MPNYLASKKNKNPLVAIGGIALAYYVAGKLGLLLAIPPGYATAIWPASGIALGGTLLFGRRVWPGILIGSFCVECRHLIRLLSNRDDHHHISCSCFRYRGRSGAPVRGR